MKLLEMGKDMKIKHSVSSLLPKYGGLFLCKFMGFVYMGSNDQNIQGGREGFTNAFSSNLNTVNLKLFPDHGERHT